MLRTGIPSVVLFCLLACQRVMSTSQTINLEAPAVKDKDLRLVAAVDPDFSVAVKKVLNGRQSSIVQQFAPWSLALDNRSNSDIVGYSVRWDVVLQDGRHMRGMQIQNQAPDLWDWAYPDRRSDLWGGPQIAIGRGHTALLTPKLVITHDTPNMVSLLSGNNELKLYGQAQSVTITLDVLVFSDGEIAGPDTLGLGADMQKEALSLYALRTQILQNHDRGLTGAALFEPAAKLGAHYNPDAGKQSAYTSEDAVAEEARSILDGAKRRGDSAAVDEVRNSQFAAKPAFQWTVKTNSRRVIKAA